MVDLLARILARSATSGSGSHMPKALLATIARNEETINMFVAACHAAGLLVLDISSALAKTKLSWLHYHPEEIGGDRLRLLQVSQF